MDLGESIDCPFDAAQLMPVRKKRRVAGTAYPCRKASSPAREFAPWRSAALRGNLHAVWRRLLKICSYVFFSSLWPVRTRKDFNYSGRP
jgi:hypothetical protein